MLLPMLRELSELNQRALLATHERFRPDLSPLLIEALPAARLSNTVASCPPQTLCC